MMELKTIEQFTAELYLLGWDSPNDAQHEHIKELWNVYERLKKNAATLRNFVEYNLNRDCSIEDCDKVARALLAKIDREEDEREL